MPKLEIGNYVNKLGTETPTGIIEQTNGDIAVVRWGIADNKRFTEELLFEELQKVPHEIFSSD